MAVLAMILSIFKEKEKHNNREIKKIYSAKTYTKQVCQTCRKNTKLRKFASREGDSFRITGSTASNCSEGQVNQRMFDKAAHEAMLKMLSVDASYYDQVRISIELT